MTWSKFHGKNILCFCCVARIVESFHNTKDGLLTNNKIQRFDIQLDTHTHNALYLMISKTWSMRKRSTCTKIVELSISVLPTKLGIMSDSILFHLYYLLYQIRKNLYHPIDRNTLWENVIGLCGKTLSNRSHIIMKYLDDGNTTNLRSYHFDISSCGYYACSDTYERRPILSYNKKMEMKNRTECTLRLNILSFCQFGMRTKGYRNVASLDISYITFIVLYGEWNVNYFLCLARSPMVLRTCDLVVHSFTIPSNHDLLYYWKS